MTVRADQPLRQQTINHRALGDLGDAWSPSVDGLLLLHRNALPKRWSDNVIVTVP